MPTYQPAEFKLVRIREASATRDRHDTPEKLWEYIKDNIEPNLDQDREQFAVIFLSTRLHVTGHHIASVGTLDTLLVHPRDVFRAAIVANAASVVVVHNHPSGDPTPSEADIRVTRDLKRAGEVLKVQLLDHIVFGNYVRGINDDGRKRFVSLRENGYLAM